MGPNTPTATSVGSVSGPNAVTVPTPEQGNDHGGSAAVTVGDATHECRTDRPHEHVAARVPNAGGQGKHLIAVREEQAGNDRCDENGDVQIVEIEGEPECGGNVARIPCPWTTPQQRALEADVNSAIVSLSSVRVVSLCRSTERVHARKRLRHPIDKYGPDARSLTQ